jgi:hypothetical protein
LGKERSRALGDLDPRALDLFDPDNPADVALLNRLPARVLRCLNQATGGPDEKN